ncbi:glycosyltransferase family 1 protein [Pseudoxanthomonas gei]|uniref:Glycosyltransferase family 1 protein n=1 Tax=Pseudoxanthomonas gei TaxID=1383030 RepID=A0ABX0AB19_9GAMM|nr:glycosyltransferase family 4 protein [Pseudoxanthomonas gei]NDK38747.1 glycosyltransferase family 1 protein [Pseudoxanthomonas gei]
MNSDAPADSILQLRSSAGLYGADRLLVALDDALNLYGVPSRLLSINNYRLQRQPLHEHALAHGCDALLLPCRGKLDMRTVAALVAQIDSCRATTLHVHDYKSAFYAWVAARRRPHMKLVTTLHGWVETSTALRLYTRLELSLLHRFDMLAVVSDEQIQRLVRAGIPRSRIRQIDNGITIGSDAPPSSALRLELGLGQASRVFAAVGRLAPEKNLPALLDAFAAVAAIEPGARLLLAGDGPEMQPLQARTMKLGLQGRVLFLGNRPDMERIYPLVDCLLLPSLSEGMPLVALEAMSRGIPVIASAVGSLPSLLAHSDEGQLVPAGDAMALRTAMIEEAARPPRHDRRAAAYVRAHHSSQAMAASYVELYQAARSNGHDRKIA